MLARGRGGGTHDGGMDAGGHVDGSLENKSGISECQVLEADAQKGAERGITVQDERAVFLFRTVEKQIKILGRQSRL